MAAAQPVSGCLGGVAYQGDLPRYPVSPPCCTQGKKHAIVAVSHSILISVYHMLKNKQPYRELGAEFLDRRNAENIKRYLLKRLERLGLQVTVRSSENAAALLA